MIAGAAVAILGGIGAGVVLAWVSASQKPTTRTLPPATAKVIRTTLVETRKVSGILGYGEPVPVRATGPGTLTWIAPIGSTVERGQPLFKVDERPVLALYGLVPLYRALRVGEMGTDVRQLEQNLSDLGYSGFSVDDTYDAATAVAVRRWQASLGLPQSGSVELGQVVFTPGAARIAGHTARLGDTIGRDSAEGGSVLSYTGTTKLVTVELEVADRRLAVEGRTATVTVPGIPAVKGTISKVSTVITTPGTPEGGTAQAGTSSPASKARIEATVTIADQAALSSVDASPVGVDFVSEQRQDVLAVPVTALLALPQGGYGVEVVDGRTTRIVRVMTGMFAAGLVEVSGEGIAEGMTVGVPK